MFGAAIFSQVPEFTQQYMQRLGGQIDALTLVLDDFDASASNAGMTRDEALAAMGGTTFLESRRLDMRKTIARVDRLKADRTALIEATPIKRLAMPHRVADTKLAKRTYDDFRPALPFTLEGAIAAAGGYLVGWLSLTLLLSILIWPFRRRSKLKPL
jgi:hypothetical protein